GPRGRSVSRGMLVAQALGILSTCRRASQFQCITARQVAPNNAFKPTPHRVANHMAGIACHVLHAPLRRGLTWVLGRMRQIFATGVCLVLLGCAVDLDTVS